jgi:hypothetical protein
MGGAGKARKRQKGGRGIKEYGMIELSMPSRFLSSLGWWRRDKDVEERWAGIFLEIAREDRSKPCRLPHTRKHTQTPSR